MFGPSFPSELSAAGLFGLPFSWSENGIDFGDVKNLDGTVTINADLSQEQRSAIEAVVAAHAPEAPAPAPVPAVVSRFQGREAMHQTPYGDTSLFEAAEAALINAGAPAMYRRAWDDLQEFHRDSEMLQAVAEALGLDSDDLDALFVLAGSIKA